MLPIVPWAFVTVLETDSGWEDAIWRDPSWSKTMAWAAVACGATAAAAAFAFGSRLREGHGARKRLWMRASLTIEAVAIVAWIVLAFTAPG